MAEYSFQKVMKQWRSSTPFEEGGDTVELKPCPFCGAEAHMWKWNYGVAIECKEWNADTHQVCIKARREEDAIEAWNRRANDEC